MIHTLDPPRRFVYLKAEKEATSSGNDNIQYKGNSTHSVPLYDVPTSCLLIGSRDGSLCHHTFFLLLLVSILVALVDKYSSTQHTTTQTHTTHQIFYC